MSFTLRGQEKLTLVHSAISQCIGDWALTQPCINSSKNGEQPPPPLDFESLRCQINRIIDVLSLYPTLLNEETLLRSHDQTSHDKHEYELVSSASSRTSESNMALTYDDKHNGSVNSSTSYHSSNQKRKQDEVEEDRYDKPSYYLKEEYTTHLSLSPRRESSVKQESRRRSSLSPHRRDRDRTPNKYESSSRRRGEFRQANEYPNDYSSSKRSRRDDENDYHHYYEGYCNDICEDMKKRTLYVKNLSCKATENDLKSLSRDITNARIKAPAEGSRYRFAFIEFSSEEKARQNLNRLNGLRLLDREIFLEWTRSKETKSESDSRYREDTARSSSRRYDDYSVHDDSRSQHSRSIKRRENELSMNVKKRSRSTSRDLKRDMSPAEAKNNKRIDFLCLFVDGLAEWTTLADLEDQFPNSLKIFLQKNRKLHYSYAFVYFAAESDAEKALLENEGRSLNGRRMKVSYSFLKPEYSRPDCDNRF